MKRFIGSLGIALLCASCATPFQRIGFMGGYSETQLSENIFQVFFRGNGYTSEERASDFSLLRSAELALAFGFKYFIIIDTGSSTKLSTYTTPRTTHTNGSGTISGNTVLGTATSYSTGGQTYLISRPRATNTIICFKDRPDFSGIYFNAEFVGNSIRYKYSIPKR
jgi:hypothetical protein